ncbi:hypothetical protein J0895_20405 [Phormidium pseudopriestleyi FRX01]|uniref:Uncharacterized protein n=1 Tax=Phormidium pseudopriestleyi FRX01 TaxID=1759528 RepID=A0ABS3FWC0_9CYAN|nr:hypothetical protein [Phormidium pseudopriestleyi FRX01]
MGNSTDFFLVREFSPGCDRIWKGLKSNPLVPVDLPVWGLSELPGFCPVIHGGDRPVTV